MTCLCDLMLKNGAIDCFHNINYTKTIGIRKNSKFGIRTLQLVDELMHEESRLAEVENTFYAPQVFKKLARGKLHTRCLPEKGGIFY